MQKIKITDKTMETALRVLCKTNKDFKEVLESGSKMNGYGYFFIPESASVTRVSLEFFVAPESYEVEDVSMDHYVTTRELAELAGVEMETIHTSHKRGMHTYPYPIGKVGNTNLFDVPEVFEWLEKKRAKHEELERFYDNSIEKLRRLVEHYKTYEDERK